MSNEPMNNDPVNTDKDTCQQMVSIQGLNGHLATHSLSL